MKTKSVRKPDREEDERVRRSKDIVLKTAYELLSERGLVGVTIDEVSKRSGVAKTTIYRHWPSRADLLLDTCAKVGAKPQVPYTGTFKGDIGALAKGMAHTLQTHEMASILPSIIDSAERDPKIAKLQARLHAGFMAPFYEVVRRGQETGDVSRKIDPSWIVAEVVGPLFYRRWFSRASLDDEFVKGVVRHILLTAQK